MRPDLHLDPLRLREHAAAAHGLSDALLGALRASPRPPAPGREEELARLETAVRRAVAELAELGSALDAVAVGVATADADAARALLRTAGGS